MALAVLGEGNWDVSILRSDGSVEPFLDSDFDEVNPEFSPDGRWITYMSDESGRPEIYVRPYPGPGPAVQISASGGREPAWSRDGRRIFFKAADAHRYFVVAVDGTGSRFGARAPELFFEDGYLYWDSVPVRSYDVTANGRLLLIRDTQLEDYAAITEVFAPTEIKVVQNWVAELEEKVP